MFQDLDFDVDTIKEVPSYYAPFLANQGAILLNTEVMKENNLPTPKSLKRLGKASLQRLHFCSRYRRLFHCLAYGAGFGRRLWGKGSAKILEDIYTNAGAHMEQSDPVQLKKCAQARSPSALAFVIRQWLIKKKACQWTS